MVTPRSNIIINQGEDSTFELYVLDANNHARDLTGYTAAAQMRRSDSTSIRYPFDITIVTDYGLVLLELTSADSWNVPPERYHYDCYITSPANVTTKIIEGIATISPGYTQP